MKTGQLAERQKGLNHLRALDVARDYVSDGFWARVCLDSDGVGDKGSECWTAEAYEQEKGRLC